MHLIGLITLILFLPLTYSFAIDCGPNSPFKFICQSEPALIEAMNPSLKLPICNKQEKKVIVQPGNLPSSAVFVTCIPSKIESCTNIVEAMIKKNTGATINIIVPNAALTQVAFADRVSNLSLLAKKMKVPVNVIPVDSEDPERPEKEFNAYNRDPGIARSNGKSSEVVLLPAEEKGGDVIAKAIRQCGDISVVDDLTKTKKNNENAEGGNFLVLPNGTLLVGKSDATQGRLAKTVAQNVKNKFGENQKVVEIKLPSTLVGHIDEVFNIVPAKGTCGIAILSSSPNAMKAFLEKNENETLYPIFIKSPRDEKFDDLRFELEDEFDAVLARGEKPSADLEDRILKYWIESKRRSGKNATGRDLLNNKVLVAKWAEYQGVINEAKKELKTHLKLPQGCQDKDLFVDIPVMWDEEGVSKIGNPVNGLYLNGHYFYSRQEKKIDTGLIPYQGGKRYRTVSSVVDFPALQIEVENILKSRLNANITDVSTPDYNIVPFRGGGNLHCATMNIILPCKSK